MTDDKIPGITCPGTPTTLAPNATVACSNSAYALAQADLDAGSVVNHATATAKWGAQTIISAPVSATVVTYTLPRLGLTKSPNPPAWQAVGDLITYTFTLHNTGGVPLSPPFTISDNRVQTWNCTAANGAGAIPVGGSATCTGTYHVLSTDTTVLNQATASGYNGAALISSTAANAQVPRFICNGSTLYHAGAGQFLGGSDILWTLVNSTGLPVHIAAVRVDWNAHPPNLTQVILGSTTLFSGSSAANGGTIINVGGPWTLPLGNTDMELRFSASASSVRIRVAFTEPACGDGVDSSLTYGGG